MQDQAVPGKTAMNFDTIERQVILEVAGRHVSLLM